MSVETTAQQDTLTPEQLAAVERARNTPYVISRSYRRPPGVKRWSHRPAVTLERDIDIVELLKRERDRTVAKKIPQLPD
jgi:hypothetical protein